MGIEIEYRGWFFVGMSFSLNWPASIKDRGTYQKLNLLR